MHERERHQRAFEVFDGAIAVPEAERGAFVTQACGGDADLEKDVLSLLKHHVPESKYENAPWQPEEPKDLTGAMVDRYRVLGLEGRGGMAVVWKAEDHVLGRKVAIKFLLPVYARQALPRRRFLREARAASSLAHPGIATVYDVGEHEGEPYIAMQFVEGRTVRQRLKEQPYAPAEAVRVALHTARVLQHAHAEGIIHRDVSPSNIMVTNDGAIIVLDFGIALRTSDSRLSRTGDLMGTMGYMAPEVLTGSSATAQSDIYSLGVVLYQMLTRYVPFHGTQSGPDGRVPDLLPEPVSRIVPGVPKEVDVVLEKALARDIAARYTSAKKFAEDLEGLLRVASLPHYPRVASRPPKPRQVGGTSARIRGMLSRLTGKSRPPSQPLAQPQVRPPGESPGGDPPPDVDFLT